MRPKAIHFTLRTTEEQAMVVALRRRTTLLPLDDCLNTLQRRSPT